MSNQSLVINQSQPLNGEIKISGAKNAVLVIMASLILPSGKSKLTNVPNSSDVFQMIVLLESLGAQVKFDANLGILEIDSSTIDRHKVSSEIMKKMRASILVMGPLLARFKRAEVALPGGCVIGARPIDYHLKLLSRMGVDIQFSGEFLTASTGSLRSARLILEYPSVGATENALMAAVAASGPTQIINAAIEPEVLDLITVLRKMGAVINILPPATIEIYPATQLHPIEHDVMPDRLEAGSLLLAASVTGGEILIPNAPALLMDVFLLKLQEMGHSMAIGENGMGVWIKATKTPQAVSFKTMPYPGFPTDLQAPMLAALCLATGTSIVQETVYENRMLHVRELQKMGAQITVEGTTAIVKGVDELYGAQVIAPDIRGGYALVVAGLAAKGQTTITGVHHLRRGYEEMDVKLSSLGASLAFKDGQLLG